MSQIVVERARVKPIDPGMRRGTTGGCSEVADGQWRLAEEVEVVRRCLCLRMTRWRWRVEAPRDFSRLLGLIRGASEMEVREARKRKRSRLLVTVDCRVR